MIFAFLTAGLASASTTPADIYFAQTAQGANSGADCADAYAWNDSTHGWNHSAVQGGGNTIHLCGTITTTSGATAITISSGGTLSGSTCTNTFTIQFESGAILQAGYMGVPEIELNGQNCITVQSASGAATPGQIQSTLNGTSGKTCPGGTCSFQQAGYAIDLGGGSNITINNLQCGPIYTVTAGDTTPNGFNPTSGCIRGTLGSNITLENLQIHDGQIGMYLTWGGSTTNTTTIANNSFTAHNWGLALNPGGTTNYTTMYVYGNKFYDTSQWSAGGAYHENHIFMFGASDCANCTLTGLYLYNNEFDGPMPSVTSEIQIFNDSQQFLQNSYFFNNIFSWASTDCGNGCGNGQIGMFAGENVAQYNNTFIGNATSNSSPLGFCAGADQPQTGVVFENNLVTTCSYATGFGPDGPPTFASGQPNYNLYANSNNWQWHGTTYSSFSNYKTATGEEANSAYYSTNPIPLCNSNTDCSNVRPTTSSTAYQFAANLHSTCNGQSTPGLGALCYDKPSSIGPNSGSTVGNARPTSGAWDAGAYQFATGDPPAPPTGLSALVQ